MSIMIINHNYNDTKFLDNCNLVFGIYTRFNENLFYINISEACVNIISTVLNVINISGKRQNIIILVYRTIDND